MEILSEQVLNFEYYGLVGLFTTIAALALLLIVGIAVDLIKKEQSVGEYIAPGAIIFLFAVAFSLGGYFTYKNGPDVEYKVIITDYNEVHKGGYEITGQEGKVVTLRKKLREVKDD